MDRAPRADRGFDAATAPGADGGTSVATPIDIAAGGQFTCAIRADRSLWCWGSGLAPHLRHLEHRQGDNAASELGLGTASRAATPVEVQFP